MDELDALRRVQSVVKQRLAHVTAEQWTGKTPCDEWSVRDLVNHLVAASHMYKAMLEGCSVEVSARILTSDALGERDALAAYDEASMKVTLAFQAPGALERICHHPMGDFTGEQPLGARIADDLIHSRDLARAIGDDESLDDDLVRVAWQVVEPLLPILGVDAGFKDGPSGRVDDDAPLRLRPLDSVGRRP